MRRKNTKFYRHLMCSFKFQMHQNPFSAGAPPWTPVGKLTTLPRISIRLERVHRELKYPYPSTLNAFGVSISTAPRFLDPPVRHSGYAYFVREE